MSDHLRPYRAIRAALRQGDPGEPTGRLVRPWTTLAAFISGIGLAQGRALPWAWRMRQGPQGPCPAELHSALVALRRAGLPEGTQGVFLGDGEGEGCRTAQRTGATWDGEPLRLETLGAWSKPGPLSALQEVKMTRDA